MREAWTILASEISGRSPAHSYFAGRRQEAAEAYRRWLPLINYENRQCGLAACKMLMQTGGIIESDTLRYPLLPVHPAIRDGLIEIARELDPLVLRWGH